MTHARRRDLFWCLSLWLPFFAAQLVLSAGHDIGPPGSYALLPVLVLGPARLAVLVIIPGNPGPNAYGPAPRLAAGPVGG